MTNPMISVVMPVYNVEKYVAEAVESILNQTYSDLEFIIIDDCSTDNSYQILKEYEAKDQRINLLKNDKNYKQAYTKNRAIAIARGKYIAFMDADDISLPERFTKQVEFMESHPEIGVCGTLIREFKNNDVNDIVRVSTDHSTDPDMLRIQLLFGGCYIAHPTTIIRREILNENQYDILMNGNAEDYELWSRLVNVGCRVINLPEVLVYYRSSVYQTTALKKIDIVKSTIEIISNNYFLYFGKLIKHNQLQCFLNFKFYTKQKINFLFELIRFELIILKLVMLNNKNMVIQPTEYFAEFLFQQSWLRVKINKFLGAIIRWVK